MAKQEDFDFGETRAIEKAREINQTPLSLRRSAVSHVANVVVILVLLLLIHFEILPQYCIWLAAADLVLMAGVTMFCLWAIVAYARIVKVLHRKTNYDLGLDGSEIHLIDQIQRKDFTKRYIIVSSALHALPVVVILCLMVLVHVLDFPNTLNWLVLVYSVVLACRLTFIGKTMVDYLLLLQKVDSYVLALDGETKGPER